MTNISQRIIFKLYAVANRLRVRSIKRNRIAYWTNTTIDRLAELPSPVCNILTDTEKREIDVFYGKYKKVNPLFHEFYKRATGKFDVRNIPDDLYYSIVDPFFNDWEYAATMDNKTFYPWMFRNIKQPKTICARKNGFWLDSEDNLLSASAVIDCIKSKQIAFLKHATLSMGGKGIMVCDEKTKRNEIEDFLNSTPNDIVVQEGLVQSEQMSRLNTSSVNTIRIMTFLRKDGTVKICSSCVRMGRAGSRVDNASSGGIVVGVSETGRLNKIAYGPDGKSYQSHPTSGVLFDSVVIPSYDNVKDAVIRQARSIPQFRLVSWDIAIDEKEEPVLIEANLFVGELEFHQLNNGPIFGEETEEILNEVFTSKKRIKYPF